MSLLYRCRVPDCPKGGASTGDINFLERHYWRDHRQDELESAAKGYRFPAGSRHDLIRRLLLLTEGDC